MIDANKSVHEQVIYQSDTEPSRECRRSCAGGCCARWCAAGPLPGDDGQTMVQWEHGVGFSVGASVRIAAADRAGRERLLHYCARPSLALDRLRELDPKHLLYESTK